MLKLYYRLYQSVFKIIVALIPFHFPKLISKENAIYEIAPLLKDKLSISSVLFVTDAQLMKLNLAQPLLDDLNTKGILVTLYDQTKANPTIDNIEEALVLYHTNKCQAILAFGGGSPIDCAKGVAARVARPHKSIRKMKGVLGVLRKTPLVIAIPTTAGTGSETTLASVVTNPLTHEKYAITDPNLFPAYAILDPILTKNLPAHITSTTGMDALTHAIEVYIDRANDEETRTLAIDAIKLIFENLTHVYQEPSDMKARLNMQNAAFKAGKAFTMAYVGNVHAIDHTLGGFYNTPHGLANAILLPRVLRYYGSSVTKKLSELSDLTQLTEKSASPSDKAEVFISHIESMNTQMKIPSTLLGIKDEDIPKMAHNAYAEANPFYPVPVIFTHKDFETLILSIRQTV
jgi:alcohol dehydrogenase